MFLIILDSIEDQIIPIDGKQNSYVFNSSFFVNLEKLKKEFFRTEFDDGFEGVVSCISDKKQKMKD